ncbi:MAG TPA: proton-conducting transporter membrane subunit [Chloroflexota bacterium]|nr:proton-conducting transporter membrane subunit [Chloroflexota bacterium]
MPTDHLVSSSASSFAGLIGPIIPGFFEVDALSLTLLICLALLAALLILCAPATRNLFPSLVLTLFFFVGAFAVVTAANVVTFFGAWELCSLFAWGIGQVADDDQSGAPIVPFQAAGALGSFLMLLGLLLLVVNRHSLILGPATTGGAGPLPWILLLAITLKSYGLLSEGWGLRPEHRFSLAGATLAGAGLLSVGMYPFFRFFGPILGSVPVWRAPVFWGATVLAVIAALAALGEADYRRALSYGAFSQFWLMILVFSIGTPAATTGAVLGAVADAFAFTGLFLCLGLAEEATARVLLRQVGGLAQRLPLTAALFVVCSISILGLPPLAGSIADGLIGVAAAGSQVLPIVWMAVAGLTLAYLIRLFATLFLGELRGPVQSERRWSAILMSGVLVGVLVLLGTLGTDVLALLQPLV